MEPKTDKMASCSWGQPPDNHESDERDSESDASEYELDNEYCTSDTSIYDIESEVEGKNLSSYHLNQLTQSSSPYFYKYL